MIADRLPNNRFGRMLRNARRHAGMTQTQLAEISTVSVRTIRDLELDRTGAPRAQTVLLLADALYLNRTQRAEFEAAAGFAVGRSLYDTLPDVPTALTSLVSRKVETASLTGLLRSPGVQVVQVTGAPGMGKTSLIHEVASRLHRTEFLPVICLDRRRAAADGVSEVPRGLIGGVAEVIGCGASLEDVAGSLAGNEVLLTVDGRDLDDGDQEDLRGLLQRCRGLRVLYETCEISSVPLGVATYSVPPLGVPSRGHAIGAAADLADYPAVQYLVSRCAPVYPDALSDPETLDALSGICRQLDGIPSALESATSWLLVYEPPELLRIAEAAPARIAVSPSGANGSLISWMRHAIASLPVVETDALRRLVDSRPWTVRDAVALLGCPVEYAERIIHDMCMHGLVRRIASERGAPQRFAALNLVRHLIQPEHAPEPFPRASAMPGAHNTTCLSAT
ncbi:helix-turn-helix transcriptional regulator [Streptomyces sp. AC555_RSS877]|uniref:helix-turn-helix domain-containing protein n=1 Tax=Streptomyces sp. AC555_RSS877 TaxID=2823688 RepID=UPI001C27C363|nr:helix-turn-helix transcriptional regulator [Streptomyces sp. AC555_RSS877]